MLGWLAATILLGGVFIVGQGLEYWGLFQSGVACSSNLFATTFFTLTGFHGLHVCVGLVALLIVLGLALAGDFRRRASPRCKAVGLYWHFVDAVWVLVFYGRLHPAPSPMTTAQFLHLGLDVESGGSSDRRLRRWPIYVAAVRRPPPYCWYFAGGAGVIYLLRCFRRSTRWPTATSSARTWLSTSCCC